MKGPRRIAIVGARCTGKTWLTRTLTDVLRKQGQTVHAVETPSHDPTVAAQAQTQAVLAIASGTVIADSTPLMTAIDNHQRWGDEGLYPMALAHQRLYDLTLVTGLDMAWPAPRGQENPHSRGPFDALLRDALTRAGIGFQVVYGQGLTRLHNALLALGLEDEAAWAQRESAQFALNRGRTPWRCEQCSDPACEHRLFTGLLQRP